MYVIETKKYKHHYYIDSTDSKAIEYLADIFENLGIHFSVWTVGPYPAIIIPSDVNLKNSDFAYWREF